MLLDWLQARGHALIARVFRKRTCAVLSLISLGHSWGRPPATIALNDTVANNGGEAHHFTRRFSIAAGQGHDRPH
jgi:hypothetical protein